MRKAIILLIGVLLLFTIISCDKKHMYAVSNHPLKVYMERFDEMQESFFENDSTSSNFDFSGISEGEMEMICSFYAASDYSIPEFLKRLSHNPEEDMNFLYAFSKHSLEAFNNRTNDANKYDFKRYSQNTSEYSHASLSVFYIVSSYSIEKYVERVKIAIKHFDDDFVVACFALSEHSITEFKKRLSEFDVER